MKLDNRVHKKNIILNLQASTRDEVIKLLSERLLENGFIRDSDQFIGDVNERESQMSTGIGRGLAIPHGKSESVLESTVVFAKTNNHIEWGSLDKEPVNIIFLLAIAKQDENDEHLRLLADISGKLMEDDFVNAIRNADSVEEIKKLLTV
ncbi:fructose PTS transporter subunit IIA [Virgibacillus sp. NKC19-3]|uniref:PTS sugar transporter subunit IIA n=1 Tax=Virgibacillus saliphilus TaxID=2831674 RepID=UPI001C9A7653|nr:fructose PTS transporter subunit IIA [Virgibacillus sp. NKC19-3]MBY7141744.1 fructose PTS transporter subunit IIA [Virgibacillus sp. NKC19-3]